MPHLKPLLLSAAMALGLATAPSGAAFADVANMLPMTNPDNVADVIRQAAGTLD